MQSKIVNNFFEISNRKIGYDYDPLVIAEIGINHNGSLLEAKKLVDAASECGVEVIKHQTHIVEDEMSQEAKKIIPEHTKESIYEIMENCALSEDDENELKKYVESKNIIFLSTPFSRAAALRLQKMNVPAYKIGSGECNNYPLIELICKFNKPIILSTGMNDINSVKNAVKIIEEHNIPYGLLHCTNIYPTPHHLVRLEAIKELENNFPRAIVGLSDHTTSNHACFGAVALGASILERHFTDNLNRKGPDIINSMDIKQCKELIEGSKILKKERGGKKTILNQEKGTIDFAYSSIVSIKPISKGEQFSEENIWVKRPGTGPLFAKDFKNLLGKISQKNIPVDAHIKKEDIEN